MMSLRGGGQGGIRDLFVRSQTVFRIAVSKTVVQNNVLPTLLLSPGDKQLALI